VGVIGCRKDRIETCARRDWRTVTSLALVSDTNMVLSKTAARAQRAGVLTRSIVTSRGQAAVVAGVRRTLPRQVLNQHAAPTATAAAGRLLKPHFAMLAQREHASAANSKLGAVRTDWT
jgi:hypothetical protein